MDNHLSCIAAAMQEELDKKLAKQLELIYAPSSAASRERSALAEGECERVGAARMCPTQ